MQILGLDPIPAALLISLIAVGLRTWWGMTDKDLKDFNFRLLSQTIIIGLLIAIIAVAGNIEAFPNDVSDLQQLIFVVSQVAAIIGIDKGVKEGGKLLAGKIKKAPVDPDEDIESMLEEIPEEAPPARSGQ